MNGNHLFIDMDVVIYSSACAAQSNFYLFEGVKYKTKKEMYESLYNRVERSRIDAEYEVLVEAAPEGHARQNARMMLQGVLDACAPIASYAGFVTGPGNYRMELATLLPYKGNRTADKPVWYHSVKEFLLSECNAVEVTGYEADDKLVVETLKNPKESILATIDKDMNQVPGIRIYNWKRKETKCYTKVEANRNFYKQLLTGDTTDNIPGLEGIGEAKAEKILGRIMVENLMLTTCYTHYLKQYGKDAWKNLIENAKLLYLCRTEDDLKDPKNAFKPCIIPEGATL